MNFLIRRNDFYAGALQLKKVEPVFKLQMLCLRECTAVPGSSSLWIGHVDKHRCHGWMVLSEAEHSLSLRAEASMWVPCAA